MLPAMSVFLAAALVGPARAQEQTPADSAPGLSLAGAVALIRAEHPLARAGSAEVRAAQAEAGSLRRYPNPSLELERANLDGFDNLALLQPIRWPWVSAALRDLGQAGVEAARAGAEAELRDVLLAVARQFVDALYRARALELAREAEALAERTLERVVAARDLGQAGDLPVLQAEVGLDGARRRRVAAEAEYEAALAELAVTLGREPGAPIQPQGELESLAPVSAPESVVTQALIADPASTRFEREAERAGQEARVARGRRWPVLAVGPALAVEGGASFGVGLGLDLPLWNRGGDAIRAATAAREAALFRLQARQRDITAQGTAAIRALARVRRELQLLRGGELARAQQADSLAERALARGGPYVGAWLAARQAYLEAREAELDLEREAAQARVLLRHLSGTLTAEALR